MSILIPCCRCLISSRQLPQLVENNPAIAIEFLFYVIELAEGQEYLSAMIGMDMSVHSLDVVNKLASGTRLPPEFIRLYISNCITSCENIKEKYPQVRFEHFLIE